MFTKNIKKHTTSDRKILLLAAVVYTAVLFGLSLYKYNHFLYTGLDLAIFTDVLTSLLNNQTWFSSIQGHSYLGDHITPALLVLLPFFAIFKSPLTLLFLQTVILAGTSFVVYRLTAVVLGTNKTNWPLIMAMTWLLNPLVWNINLFEFHIIVLALPLLFTSLLFYKQKNFKAFILTVALACLVREDIALIIVSIGAIAWIEKQPWKYRIFPILFGLFYFASAFFISSQATPDTFRFAVYYTWLGESPLLILHTLVTKPGLWLGHVVSIPNLDMFVGLLFPFLFLPLRKPKYLLLCVFPLLQFIFSRTGGSNIIYQTHYAVLFLPALLMATLDALAAIVNNPKSCAQKIATFDPFLSKLAISTFVLLTLIAFSPIAAIATKPFGVSVEKRNTLQQLTNTLSDYHSVISTYRLLPNTAVQPAIYSLHYVLLGKQQFSEQPYTIKQQPDRIIIDTADLVTYWLQLHKTKNQEQRYHEGIKNIQATTQGLMPKLLPGNVLVWDAETTNVFDLTPTLIAEDTKPVCTKQNNTLSCVVVEKISEVLFVEVTDGTTKQLYPFIWREYSDNQTHRAFTHITLDEHSWNHPLTINVVTLKGQVELGPWLEIADVIDSVELVSNAQIDD